MSNALVNLAWKVPLSPAKKVLLVRLCDRANDAGREIYISTARLIVETGLSKSSIFRVLKEFRDISLVMRDYAAPPRSTASPNDLNCYVAVHGSGAEQRHSILLFQRDRPEQRIPSLQIGRACHVRIAISQLNGLRVGMRTVT